MSPTAVLVGPLSVDRYVDEGVDLPGGGALNMAYHWSRLGVAGELVSRVGRADAALFERFLHHHGIAATSDLVVDGPSATIDIRFGADRQPHMDNFVEGVWSTFRFSEDELQRAVAARHLHAVLVRPVVDELVAVASSGRLRGPSASGDFLSFRRWTAAQFADVARHLDVAFIGWPGAVDDPLLAAIAGVSASLGHVLVVTIGERGVLTLDGRAGERALRHHHVPVQPVTGTTVGCGDAFIAHFLARWFDEPHIDPAVAAGASAGGRAVAWRRPLPDDAYAG